MDGKKHFVDVFCPFSVSLSKRGLKKELQTISKHSFFFFMVCLNAHKCMFL